MIQLSNRFFKKIRPIKQQIDTFRVIGVHLWLQATVLSPAAQIQGKERQVSGKGAGEERR
jgi:hypothetical protein